jgi:energy-coupling factor transport system permease protein
MILSNVFDLLVILAFVIILILVAKLPIFSKSFRKILIIFYLANVSIFISWIFLNTQGTIVYFQASIVIIKNVWIWNIRVTQLGIFSAFLAVLKANISFLLMLLLFTAVSDRELIYGLRTIKIPYALCIMIDLTFRGLSMFQKEYTTVKEAMMTRGVNFEKASIPQKIKNFVGVFITLIVLMFKRTEDMAASIEARGIPLRAKNRTIYHYYPFKKKDYLINIILLLFFGFSIYLGFTGRSFVQIIINLIGLIF